MARHAGWMNVFAEIQKREREETLLTLPMNCHDLEHMTGQCVFPLGMAKKTYILKPFLKQKLLCALAGQMKQLFAKKAKL